MRFLHEPRSVAVIGASDDPDKIGGRPVRYLQEFGFAGRILPVNRNRATVQGLPAHPDVSALPIVPDVALVAVPGVAAAEAVAACAQLGVPGCVVFSSGFGETGDPEARQLQERMSSVARDAGMRLVGPNSQGLANFATGAVLGFSTMFTEQAPADGPVGIVSQSGAMCSVPYGLLRRRGVGVRYAHASGNDADVGVVELAAAVLDDPQVRLLLLYLEDIRDAEPLERMARRALDRDVPVVALMGGRSAEGQRAASSHTGALANSERVVDAFFDRAGIWRARSMRELVDTAELYLQDWRPGGRDLTILSNSGAVCVLAADAAADHRLPLTTFAGQTTRELETVLPRFSTTSNPVDVTAALLADSSLLGKVLGVLAREPGVDACLLGVPVAGRGYDVPRFAADAASYALRSGRPLVVAAPQQGVAEEFRRSGLVVFEEESSAVAALAQFLDHRDLMARASARPDRPRATEVAGTDVTLNEADSLAVLERAGLSVVPRVLCADPAAAGAAFAQVGGVPVALKGCAAQVTHKSGLGLVRLGLDTVESVTAAARDVKGRAAAHGLRLDGLLVAPMVAGLHEVIVGAHRDPVFGPVVVVGSGGRHVEVLADVQLLLPPFTVAEAHAAISRLRIAPLLAGVRGEAAADVDALAAAVVRVGDLMADPGCRISSLDANPVLVGARDNPGPGAVVVDAVVTTTGRPPADS